MIIFMQQIFRYQTKEQYKLTASITSPTAGHSGPL